MKYKELLKKQIKELSSENKKPFAGLMEDLRYEYTVKGPTAIEMMQLLQDIVAGADSDTIDGLKTRLVRLDKMREYLLKSDLKGEEQRVVYKAYVKVQSAIRARKDSDKKKFDTLSRMVNEAGGGLLAAAEQVSEEFPLFKAGLMASKFMFKHAKQASDLRKQKLRERTDALRKDSELFYKREILRNKGQTGKLKQSRKKRDDDFYPNTFSGEKLGGPQTIHETQQSYGLSGLTNLAKGGPRGAAGLRESQESKLLRTISTDVKKIVKYLDWKKIKEKDAGLDAIEALREGSKSGLNREGSTSGRDKKNGAANPGLLSYLTEFADEAVMLEAMRRSGKAPPGAPKPPGAMSKAWAGVKGFGKRFLPVGVAVAGAEALRRYMPSFGGAGGVVDGVTKAGSGLVDEFGKAMPASGLVDDAGNLISKGVGATAKQVGAKAIPLLGGGVSAYFDYNERRARGQNMLRSGAGALINGLGTIGGQFAGGATGALAGGVGAIPGEIAGGIAGGYGAGAAFDSVIDGSIKTYDRASERTSKGDYLGAGIEALNSPAYAKLTRMPFPFMPSPVSFMPDELKGTLGKMAGKNANDLSMFDLLNVYRDSKNSPKKEKKNRMPVPPYLTSPSPEREFVKFLADQGVISNGPELTPMERAMKKAREEKKTVAQTASDKLPENQLSKAVDTALQVEQKNDPSKMPAALLPLAKITGARGLKDILKTGSSPLGLLFPIDPSSGLVNQTGVLDSIGNFFGKVFGGTGSARPSGPSGATSGSSGGSSGVTGGGGGSSSSGAGTQDFSGLGSLSAKYESGGGDLSKRAGLISSGQGDPGGKSYGGHQLSSKAGTLGKYIRSSKYASEFSGLSPGSAAFDAKWKEIASKDPKGFAEDQHNFITRTHYDPARQTAQKLGFKLDNRGVAESVYSGSVQHGGINKILEATAARPGFADMSPQQQIQAYYEERGTYADRFAGRNAGSGRYAREAQDAIQIANEPQQVPGKQNNVEGKPSEPFIIDPEVRKKNGRDLTPDEIEAIQKEQGFQKKQTGGNKPEPSSGPLPANLSVAEKEFIFGKPADAIVTSGSGKQQTYEQHLKEKSELSKSVGKNPELDALFDDKGTYSKEEIEQEKNSMLEKMSRGERPDISKAEHMLERYDTEKTKRTPTLEQVKKASVEEWKESDAKTKAALERVANGGDKTGAASQDFLGKGPAKKDGSPADYDPNNYKGMADTDPYGLQQANRAKELGYNVTQDPDSGEWHVNDPSGEFNNIYKAEQNLKPDRTSPNISGPRQDVANSGAPKQAPPVVISAPAQQPANQSPSKSSQESTKEESAWCDTRTASCRDAINK